MEGWILPEFRFSTRVTIQTSSMATYDEQAFALRTRMSQSGGNDWVLIGHSNGGIVSRRAAQAEANNTYSGMHIRGVLTVGSPHGGAPAMSHALPLVRGFFQAVSAPLKWKLCPGQKRGCTDALAAGDGIVQKIYEIQRDHLGAASQMTTNSSFREELERPAEPFIRASIISHSYPKWQWKRMYSDMKCYPESDCGGQEGVKRTQRLEKHLKKLTVLNALGAVGATILGQPVAAALFANMVGITGGHLAGLHLLEWGYNKWVRGDPDSDGIVPAWSQVYPRTLANQQFHIANADSHTGSTKSLKVRQQLEAALRAPFLFAIQPSP